MNKSGSIIMTVILSTIVAGFLFYPANAHVDKANIGFVNEGECSFVGKSDASTVDCEIRIENNKVAVYSASVELGGDFEAGQSHGTEFAKANLDPEANLGLGNHCVDDDGQSTHNWHQVTSSSGQITLTCHFD